MDSCTGGKIPAKEGGVSEYDKHAEPSFLVTVGLNLATRVTRYLRLGLMLSFL